MLMGAKARALAQPDSLDKICENLDRLMKTTA
jgi:UDP-N-acetylglucosamine--N-acetylmuramyl-(pentapeptide) pyrophosphoryl-undecaprenol N-acetylglucosamine transferase